MTRLVTTKHDRLRRGRFNRRFMDAAKEAHKTRTDPFPTRLMRVLDLFRSHAVEGLGWRGQRVPQFDFARG